MEPQILLSKEGVTQGCPLGMILYGVSLLGLRDNLRESASGALQPWYADDFSVNGKTWEVAQVFQLLCKKGPSVGYFPAPAKSWAICPKCADKPQTRPSWMRLDSQNGAAASIMLVGSSGLNCIHVPEVG